MKETHTIPDSQVLDPNPAPQSNIESQKSPLNIQAKRQLQSFRNFVDDRRRVSEHVVKKNPWPVLSATFLVGLVAGTLAATQCRASK